MVVKIHYPNPDDKSLRVRAKLRAPRTVDPAYYFASVPTKPNVYYRERKKYGIPFLKWFPYWVKEKKVIDGTSIIPLYGYNEYVKKVMEA